MWRERSRVAKVPVTLGVLVGSVFLRLGCHVANTARENGVQAIGDGLEFPRRIMNALFDDLELIAQTTHQLSHRRVKSLVSSFKTLDRSRLNAQVPLCIATPYSRQKPRI